MDNGKILAAIDEQISRLKQARILLGNSTCPRTVTRRVTGGKRKLSTAARARIAAAQKARWAKWKRSKKTA